MFKRKLTRNRDSIDTNDSDSSVLVHRRSKSLWNKLFTKKSKTEIEPVSDLEVPWNYVKNQDIAIP